MIQVTYDGPASTGDFVIHGTIEGQPKIVSITPTSDSGATDISNSSPRTHLLGLLLSSVFAVLLTATIAIGIARLSQCGRFGRWAVGVVIGLAISFVVGIFGYFILKAIITPYPPLGF
jgi:hypothetical protein